MKNSSRRPESDSDWVKTPFANLIRYKPSQTYFARFKVKGKLIRRSLKTTQLSVAKLRLADQEKSERQSAHSQQAVAAGKLTFGDALAAFQTRLASHPTAKQGTKTYYQYRIAALLKSWPGLAAQDVNRITRADCLAWSSRNATGSSSSSHNHTVSLLRKVFAIAIEAGARYDNPALGAQRVKERTRKRTVLPEFDQLAGLVKTIRTAGSGFSQAASELVEFLAYGGFRKTEASFITWADCRFDRAEIVVHGHPETGTKNGEERCVPMIADMRSLLEQIRADRPKEKETVPVMRVRECQKALDSACKKLRLARITHHDLRHLFATRSIESGVDIPTVSRWLGHKDGGALAMKVYGHLRDQHSAAMAQRVTFSKPPGKNNNTPATNL